jgi:hypothetical protein
MFLSHDNLPLPTSRIKHGTVSTRNRQHVTVTFPHDHKDHVFAGLMLPEPPIEIGAVADLLIIKTDDEIAWSNACHIRGSVLNHSKDH